MDQCETAIIDHSTPDPLTDNDQAIRHIRRHTLLVDFRAGARTKPALAIARSARRRYHGEMGLDRRELDYDWFIFVR